MAETHPNAFRIEASEKRELAKTLLAEADSLEAKAEELDPTPKPKKESPKEESSEGSSRSAEDGKFVSKEEAEANPSTTVTESKPKHRFGRRK